MRESVSHMWDTAGPEWPGGALPPIAESRYPVALMNGLIGFLVLCFITLSTPPVSHAAEASPPRSIHVFVALADNEHQGIVPVPKTIGNGEDPKNNLYWGALYGVKTYFRKSADWKLISCNDPPAKAVLERCVFRHKKSGVHLIADAYRGVQIKQAIVEFLAAAGGGNAGEIVVGDRRVPTHGGASLVTYIGHNGLMDFDVTLDSAQVRPDSKSRDAIVLACLSKSYFDPLLVRSNAKGVVLTTGLMAPEAYTLKAALDVWISGGSPRQMREAAAKAYNKYQKCGLGAARRLFASGKT